VFSRKFAAKLSTGIQIQICNAVKVIALPDQSTFEMSKDYPTIILSSAKRLLKVHGLQKLYIHYICDDLRMSKKTFYKYFESKESILMSILKKEFANLSDHVAETQRTSMNAIDTYIYLHQWIVERQSKIPANALKDLPLYPLAWAFYQQCRRIFITTYLDGIFRTGITMKLYRDDLDFRILAETQTNTYEILLTWVDDQEHFQRSHQTLLNHFLWGICTHQGHQQMLSRKAFLANP